MEHKVADYYDMPLDLLPSANFAARPSSEISDNSFLEGLWTFMLSSSESESEDTPTPTNRQSINPSELPTRSRSRLTDSVVTSTEKAKQSGSGSPHNDNETAQRPRLRKQVATAPPGTFSLQGFAPQPPRRAISAKRKSSQIDRSRSRSEPQDDVNLSPTTNSSPWSKSNWLRHRNENSATDASHRQWNPLPSFSAKARVQRTLRVKKITSVKTCNTALGSENIVRAPLSIIRTPSEMYPVERTVGNCASPQYITPLPLNSPQLCLSSQQDAARKLFSLRRSQDCYRSETGTRLKVYIPGRIRPERHSVWQRRDSAATLDEADEASETGRLAEEADLASIASYFADMGVVDETTAMGQDRFWLGEVVNKHDHKLPRRYSASSSEETSLDSPHKCIGTRSSRASRFSFSSDPSGASNKLSWGPIRQRIRLKRLLSPALPGFQRIPAISQSPKDDLSSA